MPTTHNRERRKKSRNLDPERERGREREKKYNKNSTSLQIVRENGAKANGQEEFAKQIDQSLSENETTTTKPNSSKSNETEMNE